LKFKVATQAILEIYGILYQNKFYFYQLEPDGEHLIESCDAADEFSKHFQSVYNNPWPVVVPTLSSYSEFLSLAPVSDSGVFISIKRLRPTKSVEVDDILGFIIKGCTDIFVPVLKHICNLSYLSSIFLLEASSNCSCSQKGNSASVNN
jgi:hypothetical protein